MLWKRAGDRALGPSLRYMKSEGTKQPVKQGEFFSFNSEMKGATSPASYPCFRLNYKPRSASVLSASGVNNCCPYFSTPNLPISSCVEASVMNLRNANAPS